METKLNNTTAETYETYLKLAEAQPRLMRLYKEAGFLKAMELQKKIEERTGKSVFDNPVVGTDAANCFHGGTWQIWNGDGVSDMIAIMDQFHYTADKEIKSAEEQVKYIREFVKSAEEYLSTMTVEQLRNALKDMDGKIKVKVIMDGVIDEDPTLNVDDGVLYIEAVSPEAKKACNEE